MERVGIVEEGARPGGEPRREPELLSMSAQPGENRSTLYQNMHEIQTWHTRARLDSETTHISSIKSCQIIISEYCEY